MGPFLSNLLEHIWWDGELGGAGIDNGWVGGVFSWLLHGLTTIVHTLTLESPGTEPVLKVLECLESLGASDDLGGVVASEKSIRGLTHFPGSDTETDHGPVNDLVILEGPQVVKLLLLHVLVRGKTEDTIGVVSEALRFVEGKELEKCALVILQVDLQLVWGDLILALKGLDAGVVLPYETLELS